MSAIDRINKKRKQLEEQELQRAGKVAGSSSMQRIESLTNELRNNNKIDYPDKSNLIPTKSTIRSTSSSSKTDNKPWYTKILKGSESFDDVGSAFDDGYQFGDGLKTIRKGIAAAGKTSLATGAEINKNLAKGALKVGEGVLDIGTNLVASGQNALGFSKAAQKTRDFADKDLSSIGANIYGNTNPTGALYNMVSGNYANILNPLGLTYDKDKSKKENYKSLPSQIETSATRTNQYEKDSISGEYADKTTELVGYTLGMIFGTKGLDKAVKGGSLAVNTAKGTTAIGAGVKGGNVTATVAGKTLNLPILAIAGGMSSGLEEANSKEDVTETERWSKALSSGLIEGVTEGLFGMFGVGGNEFTDVLGEKAAKAFTSKAGKMLAKVGISSTGEAAEEFLSYAGNYLADNHLIDKIGNADFSKEWDWGEVGEQMALAFASSVITSGGGTMIQTNSAIAAAEKELGRKLSKEEKAQVTQASIEGTLEDKLNKLTAENEISNTTTLEEQTNSLVEAPSNALNNDNITKTVEELQSELKNTRDTQKRSEIALQIRALEEGYNSVQEYTAAIEQERQESLIAPVRSQESPVIEENIPVKSGQETTINSQAVDNNEVNNNVFAKQVDEYVNGTYNKDNHMTVLEHTPEILQKLGVKDLPITLTSNKLDRIMNDSGKQKGEYHGLHDLVKKIPESLQNPLDIVKSHNNSYVLTTDLSDNKDRTIIASIKIDGKGYIDNVEIDTNVMTSAYGRNNYESWMNEHLKNGDIVYDIDRGIIDTQKSDAISRLQLPSNNVTSDKNVSQNEENVNLPTKQELDNLEDTRKNKSGSEYASAFFDLRDKYGQANLYKGINEYNSNAKNGSVSKETTSKVQEELAPIKEATKELKTAKKEIVNQVKELKKTIDEFKVVTQEQLEDFSNQYQEDLKSLKEDIVPLRNNLTQEENTRYDELEQLDKAGFIDSEELSELENLRSIVNNEDINNIDFGEYFTNEYGSPEFISPKVVQEKIKQNIGMNDAEATSLYNTIANNDDFVKEDLYKTIEDYLKKSNEVTYENNDVREVRNYIRSVKIDMTSLKSQFPSSKDYNNFRKSNFGKVKMANSGMGVDVFYQELSTEYPQYFDSSIKNEMDQLEAIVDFMNNNPIYEVQKGTSIPEEVIEGYADEIYNDVINAEVRKELDAELDLHIDNLRKEEIVAPVANEEIKAPTATEEKIIPKDPTKESSYDNDVPKTRKQLQRRLDTVNRQIERISDLESRMWESAKKYDKKITEVQELMAIEKIKNGPLSPMEEFLNENIIQGIYEKSAPVAEKYDKYHTKLQELTEERNHLEEQIENTPEKKTQKAIQQELVNKTGIIEEGLDNANRMSKFMLNNTDPIRIQEMVFGQEVGTKINEEFFQKVKDNTSEKTRWLNQQRARIKELGIKARSKESAAVQKYAEKKWVSEKNGEVFPYGDYELSLDFPNVDTQNKIKRAAKEIRSLYDEYLDTVNPILEKLGYSPITKRTDYVRHFQELNDKFSQIGIPLNLNDMKMNDLPTDINGITADFKPGKNFFANALQRRGLKTSYDAITGIDGYLEGISNLIYHTEDIQRLRGFENYIRDTYGQEHGYENLEELTEEQKAKRLQAIENNSLSNYASWLHEYTNQLAGKKAMVDRSFEDLFGRKIYSMLDTVNKQVGANMIGFNISSAMTNAIAGVQAIAKTNKVAAVKGLADSVKNIFHNDGFVEKNGFLTSRFGSERLSKTPWQKMQDAGYMFMSGTDNFISNFIVRSKFNELKAKGLSDSEAHIEAGKFASKLMADRSQGGQATLYNSKVLGVLTKFQYEVNNQLYSMFYDTFQESKAKSNGNVFKMTASMASTLGQLAIFTHIFGTAFEKMAGYNPTFDIIGIIAKAMGFDDDEDSEDKLEDNLGQAFNDLLKALPYSSIFTGGRIPIGEALPIKELITGKDSYGNETSRLKTLKETIPYWLLPTGYGQAKKTIGGLQLFDEDLPVPGSYTDSGNLRFTVEDTPENRIKSAVFGKWSNEEARKYIDSEFKTIKASSVEELADLGMKSSEYRKLKNKISEAGKTNKEKVDYITSLDNLNDKQKNILINNILDRDYDVDASNYSNFGSYEEFDYSYKNPEKYKWLKENNISYNDYVSSDDTKEMYDYAYKNPDKYELGKAATNNFSDYYTYKQDINDMTADKDSSGKSISGSRKAKVVSYVNGLNLSIPQKAMIIRTEYSSFDNYNNEIVSYIDNLDIPYYKKVSVLESLDFKVYEDGTVGW